MIPGLGKNNPHLAPQALCSIESRSRGDKLYFLET